jgi:hypothetical protein
LDDLSLNAEVIMFNRHLIMASLAGGVIVVAGLALVDSLAGATPRIAPGPDLSVPPQQKAAAVQRPVIRQLTTAKPLGDPVAYGFIDGSGKIVAGSGNFTCEWRGTSYYLAIAGLDYVEEWYLTFVTPAHTVALSPLTGVGQTNAQGETELRISFTFNSTYQASAFQFITYKIP